MRAMFKFYQVTQDESAHLREQKSHLDIEMLSVNLKIDERVAAVRVDFEVQSGEIQIQLENVQAERNHTKKLADSLAKELGI